MPCLRMVLRRRLGVLPSGGGGWDVAVGWVDGGVGGKCAMCREVL